MQKPCISTKICDNSQKLQWCAGFLHTHVVISQQKKLINIISKITTTMKRKQKRNNSRRKFTLDEWIVVPRNRFIECPFAYSYGDDVDYDRWLDSESRIDRWRLAKVRYGLDELAHDSERLVRKAVAEMGYAQEILSKDTDKEVREAVARTQERMRRKLHTQDPVARADAIMAYEWKGKKENRLVRIIRRKYKIDRNIIDRITFVDDDDRFGKALFTNWMYPDYPEEFKQ